MAETRPWLRAGLLEEQEKLPLLLLGLCYGLYCFFLNLIPHLKGGITEAEEWRIFIAAWITVPPLAVGAAAATWRVRRGRCAAVSGFYPALLGFNALFWSACFGYFFASAVDPDRFGTEQAAVVWIALLYPLLALAFLGAIQKFKGLPPAIERFYTLLPLLALLAGLLNFSGLKFTPLRAVELPWVVIDQTAAVSRMLESGVQVEKGQLLLQTHYSEVTLNIISRTSGILQVEMPWKVLEGTAVAAWLAAEGQQVGEDQPLLTLTSQKLEIAVYSRVPGVLGKILLPAGTAAAPGAPLCLVASSEVRAGISLLAIALAAALGLLAFFQPRAAAMRRSGRRGQVLDGLVLLAIALVVWNPAFPFDIHHYNFYLGPVNDLLHGKSLLIDINCQYGVLVIYFLALIFKAGLLPFSYRGLSALVSTLLMAQYLLIYLLMRRLLNSQLCAALALGLILIANFFSQLDEAAWPSIGPLRFGLPYLLLALAALRAGRPAAARPARLAAHALVGLASVWSVETFFYTLAAHLGILVWERLGAAADRRDFLRRLGTELSGSGGAVALAHLAVALHIRSRSGEWPHWDRYLDYIALYSAGEFGTLPVDPWTPWALIAGIYLVSMLLLAWRAAGAAPGQTIPELGVVAGLTVFGIAQFTYFLGRSHVNNLHHVCIPALILAAYWFGAFCRSGQSIPRGFRRTATYAFYVSAMLLFIRGIPYLREQWEHTAAQALLSGRSAELWSSQPTRPQVAEALQLIEQYAGDQERIALFLDPDLTTEALMLSGKANVFPLSHPVQDGLLAPARERALNFAHGLQPGDLLFLTRELGALHEVQRRIVARLNREFALAGVDTTPQVIAIRLRSRQGE